MTINKLLTILAFISVITFIVSLVAIPWIISKMPEDYFSNQQQHSTYQDNYHPLIYLLLRILKNITAIIFIIAGFIMLFTPGQGLLTILVGLGLTDFPGRFALEQKIVRNKKIFNALNWVRKRTGVAPFIYPTIPA
jgi:archaellum biogenesis protein FlaJ (TadC family)